MATLQQTIANKVLAKLSKSPDVDATKIDQLKALLASGKKVKIEEPVKIFSLPAGGELK
jgi:hypothetical protein